MEGDEDVPPFDDERSSSTTAHHPQIRRVMTEGFAALYPMVFFDGEAEHGKGQVEISSALTYKKFQGLVSQQVGLPANRLSPVFICRRTPKSSEKKKRLPINENTSFNRILNQHNPNKEKDCYFLVSIKKPKRERRGPRKRGTEAEALRMGLNKAYSLIEGALPTPIPYGYPPPSSSPILSVIGSSGSSSREEDRIFMGDFVSGFDESSNGRAYPRPRFVGLVDPPPPYTLPRSMWNSGGHPVNPPPPPLSFNVHPYSRIMENASPQMQDMYQWINSHYIIGIDNKATTAADRNPYFLSPVSFESKKPRDSFSEEFDTRPGLISLGRRSKEGAAVAAGVGGGYYSSPGRDARGGFSPPPSSSPSLFSPVQDLLHFCDVCHDCQRKSTAPPFHWCVQDQITRGFGGPSPAGPIQRPMKRHIEAAA